MTSPTDPRQFLYRDQLSPDEAQALTAAALGKADDGELYLQYARSEAFGFDDGRLKTASYDTHSGFGLRAVSGETTAFAHANEISAPAIRRAAETMALIDPATGPKANAPAKTNRHLYTDIDPLDLVPFADKVNLCQTIDAAARARDPRVAQVSVSLSGIVERGRDRPRRRLYRDRRAAAGAAQRVDRCRAERPAGDRHFRAGRALSLRVADGAGDVEPRDRRSAGAGLGQSRLGRSARGRDDRSAREWLAGHPAPRSDRPRLGGRFQPQGQHRHSRAGSASASPRPA